MNEGGVIPEDYTEADGGAVHGTCSDGFAGACGKERTATLISNLFVLLFALASGYAIVGVARDSNEC